MRVFISYSRHDEGAVRSMVGDLQRAQVQVWLDEDLGGGDAWWTEILQQIRECTVFLFALSHNSLYSKPCRAELGYAQALGLPILPVQLGEVSSYRADPIFSRQLIDYRQPTVATGFALMGALNQHAADRADLPDPLPDTPPIPYEYLQRLGASIHDPAMLTPPVQGQMLFELRNALHEEDDPTVLNDIRDLLRTLRRRTDVTYPIASEIDTILRQEVDSQGADGLAPTAPAARPVEAIEEKAPPAAPAKDIPSAAPVSEADTTPRTSPPTTQAATAQPPTKKVAAKPPSERGQTSSQPNLKPKMNKLMQGTWAKVVAAGDDHYGQIAKVIESCDHDDDDDDLDVIVKFRGDSDAYAFRRDELKPVAPPAEH